MRTVKAVVIHYNGPEGATPDGMYEWFNSGKASSHYAIGLDGEIVQFVPESEEAFACGSEFGYTSLATRIFGRWPHDQSIQIEVCNYDKDGRFTAASEKSLVSLTADIVKRYSLPKVGILRHYDVSSKVCPAFHVNNPTEWTKLRNKIWNRSQDSGLWLPITAGVVSAILLS
jgi:N-acetyl-anhydromuramyl-L-alanine amidase AmpD